MNITDSPSLDKTFQFARKLATTAVERASTASPEDADLAIKKSGEMIFKGFIAGLQSCDKEALATVVKTTATAIAEQVDVPTLTQKSVGNIAEVVKHVPPELATVVGKKFSKLSTYFVKEVDISESSKHVVKQASYLAKDSAPLATALVMGGLLVFGAFCGVHYVYKTAAHNIGRPTLGISEQSNRLPFYKNYIEPWFAWPSSEKPPLAPVFTKDIQRKMTEFTASFSGLAKDGKPFQNLLIYGPPGTGKTMVTGKIVRDIAKDLGGKVNCIRISGGDFEQFGPQAITEVHKLFDQARDSEYPTILIIDEFEALGGDRVTHLRKELIALQDAFLSRTGAPSKNFMMIATTNLVDSLDDAIVDRFSHQILISLPRLEQRSKIISQALDEYFSPTEIFSLFPGNKIREIAAQTEGFSARKIIELISKIDSMRYLGSPLTPAIVDRKVRDSVEEANGVRRLRNPQEPMIDPDAPVPESAQTETSLDSACL